MSEREAREVEFEIIADLPTSIWLNRWGAYCGYVGVPPTHPWYGHIGDEPLDEVSVHGGLTYYCHERVDRRTNPEWLRYSNERMALNPAPWSGEYREPDWPEPEMWIEEPAAAAFPHDTGMDVWWVGFDCAHAGDLVPGIEGFGEGVFRDLDYVRNEVRSLVTQAVVAYQVAQALKALERKR